MKLIFRRGLRLRGKKLCDADEEEEERKDGEEEQEEREKEKEKEEENNEEGEIQVDTDDCEVCPGTEASYFLIFVLLFNSTSH